MAEEPLLSLGRGFSAPAVFRTAASAAHERAILMGSDSDAFNRWEAGQILAAEIMLEVARQGARPTPMPTISTAIGDVLARAEDDPAFAAQMLMPPTESELARQEDAGRPRRHPRRARWRWCGPIAPAHRDRLAQLYEHMRDARAAISARTRHRPAAAPCAMPACAISPPPTTKPRRAWPKRITAPPPT